MSPGESWPPYDPSLRNDNQYSVCRGQTWRITYQPATASTSTPNPTSIWRGMVLLPRLKADTQQAYQLCEMCWMATSSHSDKGRSGLDHPASSRGWDHRGSKPVTTVHVNDILKSVTSKPGSILLNLNSFAYYLVFLIATLRWNYLVLRCHFSVNSCS